jgi:hypothetical protein
MAVSMILEYYKFQKQRAEIEAENQRQKQKGRELNSEWQERAIKNALNIKDYK